MKNFQLPPPTNSKGYTVSEICEILRLSNSQVSNLLKELGVPKTNNKYYAQQNHLMSMLQRERRNIKEYDLL